MRRTGTHGSRGKRRERNEPKGVDIGRFIEENLQTFESCWCPGTVVGVEGERERGRGTQR